MQNLIIKLILPMALLVSLMSGALAADGKVVFIKGDAFVNNKQIKMNATFNYGDTFSTGNESMAVIRINPGLQLKLKANSELQIKKPKKIRKSNGKEFTYILNMGEIFIKAKKNKINKHNFVAKDSVMGIRGTEFFISNSKKAKKNIWMCVNEGAVEVSVGSNKKSVLVKAGQGVQINSEKLPEVKQYKWTKDLNWNMQGSYDEIKDQTDIQNINYDLESFDYD